MSGVAAEVVRLLRQCGSTLAVAESLTGGLVAAELTSVPGASRCFRGSVTAYATDLKSSLLGVDPALLAARGAVDPQVATQMALGVRRVLSAEYGVATTGVAGPESQDGVPVGTVYVALAGPDGTAVGSPWLPGVGDREMNREMIRGSSVDAALEMVHCALIGTHRVRNAKRPEATDVCSPE